VLLQSKAILPNLYSYNFYGFYGFEMSVVCSRKIATKGLVK